MFFNTYGSLIYTAHTTKAAKTKRCGNIYRVRSETRSYTNCDLTQRIMYQFDLFHAQLKTLIKLIFNNRKNTFSFFYFHPYVFC